MNKSFLADITLLVVVLIWGATFVVVQDAIAFLTPFSFNAIRFFIAFLILFLFYMVLVKNKDRHFSIGSLKAGVSIGIWLFLGYAFQTIGLLYTTPGKAGFITGLSVVLVPILSYFLLKHKLHKNVIIGVICATAGLYMITMMQSTSFGKGDFFVLLCALSFAMHIIMTGRYAKHHHAMPLTLIQIATVTILSFISSLLFENPSEMYQLKVLLQKEVFVALLITGFLATAFAFLAQTYFQAFTSPTRVAFIFALEPVFAALTSYFVIGEQFTGSMLFGCLLILAGIILAELPTKKTAKEDHGQTI